ncbi:MAG: PorP/SprF family type IX secretion system membrane protein [Flavobacteriales bacterium]
MNKYILLYVASLAISATTMAQNGGGVYDPVISMYGTQPLYLNPALCGNMDSKWRATLNYREHGYTVHRPYRTAAGAFDIQLPINAWNGNIWGFGLNFLSDDQGDVRFFDRRINGSFSLGQYLDPRQMHSISVGFQGGLGWRGISYGDVYWDNQWVGQGFDLQIDPNESLDENVKGYFDLSTGLQYTYYSGKLTEFTGGVSMYHVNRPDVSLLNDTSGTSLQRRYNIHAELTQRIREGNNWAIKPNFLYSRQVQRSLITGGTKFQFLFSEGTKTTGKLSESSVTFGGFIRGSKPDTISGTSLTFIATVQMEFAGFSFGGGYDVPILGTYLGLNGFEGGFEFMISYRAGHNRGLYNKYSPHRKGRL